MLLSRADPNLQVHRLEQAYDSSHGRLLGWPTWVAMTACVTLLLQLGYLISGPETWRATRWAWFWVMTVPVVGTVLMLLLSGRTPGLPAPSTARPRLTGGWAFLLGSAATTLLSVATTNGGT